jgi:ribose transport system substrate-binding protein
MRLKKFKTLAMGTILALALAACGQQETAPEPAVEEEQQTVEAAAEGEETEAETETTDTEKIMIGYSPMTLVNPYFSAVGSAIEEVVEANGAELVKFDPQMDASVQAAQIDDMISMGVKAILFIPVDSAGSRNIMQACKDAGVYVVNIDNVVSEEDYDVVDAIVASDNYGLGYVSGEDVVERFPDGAKIGIMHSPTSESCIVTVNAFWDAIKEKAADPDAYVNVAEADGKGNMEQSFTQATDMLQAHDDIDLFYCVNDQSAFGVIQAIKEAGKAGEVAVYGKDGSPDAKAVLGQDGFVQSSGQSPLSIGRIGAENCFKLINGEEVEFNTSIEAFSITAENVEEYGIDEWQ